MSEDLNASDVLNSPALPVLLALESAGVRVELKEGRVHLSPAADVTPEQRQILSAHAKAVRILVVIAMDEGVQARREVFRQQIHTDVCDAAPLLVFRPGTAYVPGVCYSCADRLEHVKMGRCWRCALAARLASHAPVPDDLALALDEARLT